MDESPHMSEAALRDELASLKSERDALRTELQVLKGEANAEESPLVDYRLLVESQNDLVVMADLTQRFIYTSPSYCELVGMSQTDLNGKNLMPFVHPDEHEETMKVIRDIMDPPHQVNVELRTASKEGWRWISWSARGVLDESGVVKSIIGVGRDITEKKKLESSLLNSNKDLNTYFNSIAEGLFVHDLDTLEIKQVNQAACRLLHMDEEALLGRHLQQFCLEDGTFSREEAVKRFCEGSRKEAQMMEWLIKPEGLEAFWVEIQTVPCSLTESEEVITVMRDISKRKQTLQAISDAQLRFQNLFEHIPVGLHIYRLDSQERLVLRDFNPAAVNSLRIAHEELIGKSIEHVVPFLVDSELMERLKRIARDGGGWREEEFSVCLGEETRYYQVDLFQVVSSTVAICFFDTTEPVQSRQALNQAVKTYRNLFLNSQVGLFQTSLESGELIEANEVVARMAGFDSRREFLASRVSISDLYVNRGDRERILRELVQNGEVRAVEVQMYDIHGSLLWGRISAKLDQESKVIEGVIEDITFEKEAMESLRQTQGRLELVIDAANLGTWDWEIHSDTVMINSWTYIMLGLEERSSESLEDWVSYVYPDDREIFVRGLKSSLRDKQGVMNLEYRMRNTDGEIFWVSHTGRVVSWDAEGRPKRAAGIQRDITDRKGFEEQIITAKEEAESANRAKSEFLALMSHEIRTPLNAILGFNEILSMDLDDEEQLGMHQTIKESGNLLLNIINDILDLSKIEAGRIDLESFTFSPSAVVNEVIQLMGAVARDKQLSIELEEDEGVHEVMVADANRWKQVITNILSNAVKFTEQGGVKVHLASEFVEQDLYRLVLSVTDTGIGISEQQMTRLFKPFSQADSSTSRRFGGTGLGLVLCKKLCEKMGGTILVKSVAGEGSTFTAKILAKVPGTGMAKGEGGGDTQPSNETFAMDYPLDIVVADDVPHNMMLAVKMLRRLGYEPSEAWNGEDAIQKLEGHGFDVVLMDLHMPEMNGFEASKIIRDNRVLSHRYSRPVQLVAMTACTMEEDRAMADSVGMDGFLTKPVNLAGLKQSLLAAHRRLTKPL